MKIRRSILALAVAGSMAAGGVAGALVFAPRFAGAQDTPTPPPWADESVKAWHRCHRGPFLSTAAGAIGIEATELASALREGRTVAEVAQENGVDVQTVVDALVAEVAERIDRAVAAGWLTQEQADEKKADLEERIAALVNGEYPEWVGHPGRWRHGPWWTRPEGDAA